MIGVVLAIVSGICQVSIVWILVRRINLTIEQLDTHRCLIEILSSRLDAAHDRIDCVEDVRECECEPREGK